MALKTFVRVGFQADEQGGIQPVWMDFRHQRYLIDKVLESRPACAVNAGGTGLRYLVRIGQRKAYLFLDDFNRWFVEEKVPYEIARMGGLVHGELYPF